MGNSLEIWFEIRLRATGERPFSKIAESAFSELLAGS